MAHAAAGVASAQLPPASPWEAEFLEAASDANANAVIDATSSSLPAPRPPWALRVLRSVQLDAERLDAELRAMLHEQLSRALSQGSLFPAARVAQLEPEAGAAVALLVWLGTVRQGRATPGSALMNLRYRDERPFVGPPASSALARAVAESSAAATAATRAAGAPPPPSWVFGDGEGVEGRGLTRAQRLLFGVGYVLVPYLWARAGRAAAAAAAAGGGGGRNVGGGSRFAFAAADGNDALPLPPPSSSPASTSTTTSLLLRRLGQAAPTLEAAWRAAALLNLLAFLRRGVYRSLLERALSARLVPERPCAPRSVSFEYLNRQLVWQELSEFVLFVLPLLDARQARLRAAARRWLPQPLVAGGGGGGGSGGVAVGAAASSWTVAPALPGEEEEDREEEARRRAAGKRGVRRRAGSGSGGGGGGGGGDGGGSTTGLAGWLAQQVGAAASAMAGVVAAGAARAMNEEEGEPQQQQQQDGGGEAAEADAAAASGGGGDPSRPPGPCPLCGVEEIVTPYVALPCRHVFCYYCLRANTEGDARFACPVDGRRVAALRRWAPALVMDAALLPSSSPGEGAGMDEE